MVNCICGQCKTQTADCRLQTADCRLQTADWRTGVKCRLRVKCRLQTEGKMQTEDKIHYYPTALRRVQITPKMSTNITRYLYSGGPVRQVCT